MSQIQDNEIDLFELLQTLWDGKWKIIATTLVAAVIGVFSGVVKPNSFEVSTLIQSGKQSAFLQYTSLNELLKAERIGYHTIDSNSIFREFVLEFNDYEEMAGAISSSEFVQNSIKDLDDKSKQRALIGFAKSFELKALSKNGEKWVLYFKWHDKLEGLRLLNDAIQKTLFNIRNVTKANIDNLAVAIDVRNARELENLNNELNVIRQTQVVRIKKRVQYLKEQSAIAKELGIKTNSLDANALSQIIQNGIAFSVSSNEVPFYLRGYKAIDKEISLIQNRTEEEKLLSANGYLRTKEKIYLLETDLSSSQLRNASEMIATDNPSDWVQFDLAIADSKSQKNVMLPIAISIVLGGIIGITYVLISSGIRKRKEQLAKV